jgi:hypothetical protein
MHISQNTPAPLPVDSNPVPPANAPTSSTTGFWALFTNANFPEPYWNSASPVAAIPAQASAAPTGAAPTGMEALFSNPSFAASTVPVSGPTGMEALFSNPNFPASTQPITGPTGFEALFSTATASPAVPDANTLVQDLTQPGDLYDPSTL